MIFCFACATSITLGSACLTIDHSWILGSTELFRTPETIFRKALKTLSADHPDGFASVPATNGFASQTIATDIAELNRTLQTGRWTAEQRASLVDGYGNARQALDLIREQRSGHDFNDTVSEVPVVLPSAPAGLPQEFALYFDGSVQFHIGNTNAAREIWMNLMELPHAQRLNRSTWAVFMLGKLRVDADPELAIELFQEVRRLAQDGFSDGLGLASASLGWEARARLNLGDPGSAIELYLEQQDTGDLDTASLWRAARAALELPPDTLARIAGNRNVSEVVSSYLLSHSAYLHDSYRRNGNSHWEKWLNAGLAAGRVDPSNAEQFAWIAYQSGNFESSARWLTLADPQSPGALWLGARLKLRDGDIDAAAMLLAEATRSGPLEFAVTTVSLDTFELDSRPGRNRLHGEWGALRFQQQDYVDALNTLLLAGYWRDAAYVADRILLLDELKEYVDQIWPLDSANRSAAPDTPNSDTPDIQTRIRYLLARRLAREERYADAKNYYPAENRARFDELVGHLENSRSGSLSQPERARHLAAAAMITRIDGLDLYGTATAPDWEVFEGKFTYFGPSLELRENPDNAAALTPNTEEKRRHALSGPTPDEKFHYRYRASELAWEAAELMPNQSNETAALLNRAGRWHANRDPAYADKFYKALVVRCGHTELGTAADRKRWFPAMTEAGRLDEPMPPPVETTYSGPWAGDPNQ